jgi:hypothetical protein
VSQLATFFLLPANRFEDLVVAATPRVSTVEQRHFIFFKRTVSQVTDGFGSFLRSVAREGEDCPYPGDVFLDLDFVLQPHNLVLFDIATRDLSDRLSKAADLPDATRTNLKFGLRSQIRHKIPVFDHATALLARAKLVACCLDESEVRAYSRETYGPADEDTATATILSAIDLTKRWLASTRRDQIGVLNVG